MGRAILRLRIPAGRMLLITVTNHGLTTALAPSSS